MATGVLPFVRGVDFTKNDFSVSLDTIKFASLIAKPRSAQL